LPIGLVKLRAVRPFPDELLRERLAPLKAVAVLERDVSVGAGGVVYTELTRSLYQARSDCPLLIDYILGLGGRDVTYEDVESIALALLKEKDAAEVKNPIRWHKVRGLS
ncbi:MAG: pyruvate ferredoxin oxidoreductase, partial [Deltaproteobacteria bacterium]|nr:pyruvate ferredoxin oxidoreductase [Deltaproteobacteria bacterium]